MRPLVLAFLLIGLATVFVPPLRERADPYLDRFGTYVAEKLEGPISPIVNPYRRLRAESSINRAVQVLVRDRNEGLLRPRPDEFRTYLERRVEDEDGLDPWGSPFLLELEADSVGIRSAGPDMQYETEDDILVKIRYGVPAYMRFRR